MRAHRGVLGRADSGTIGAPCVLALRAPIAPARRASLRFELLVPGNPRRRSPSTGPRGGRRAPRAGGLTNGVAHLACAMAVAVLLEQVERAAACIHEDRSEVSLSQGDKVRRVLASVVLAALSRGATVSRKK